MVESGSRSPSGAGRAPPGFWRTLMVRIRSAPRWMAGLIG